MRKVNLIRVAMLLIVGVVTLGATTKSVDAAPTLVTVPNAGFEERETFDPFLESIDKYNQWSRESWRHFELGDNGGPLRIWNPGDPNNPADLTTQGIADVGFGGNAAEGKYMVVVRSRQNDPARTFEAATQLLTEEFDSTMTYTLSAQVGRLPTGEAEGGSINYTPDWFGYSLQFVVGGTNVDGATFAGQVTGGTILAEDHNSLTVPINGFVTSTVTYTPNPADSIYDGMPIQIRLAALETPVNPEDDSLAGWVAFDDVNLTKDSISTRRPGDVNNDGSVNGADVAQFVTHYGGVTGQGFDEGDFNADFITGLTDLLLLKQNFDPPIVAAVAVPEPSTLVLSMFAIVGIALVRRRKK